MKRTDRTTIYLFLACLLIVLCTSYPIAYASPVVYDLNIVSEINSTPSEYGLTNSKLVDESGNEICFEKISEQTLNTKAQVVSELPERLDYRDIVTLPPARDQGLTTGCWAFATISCLEIYDILHGYPNTIDYSEAHLVWFTNKGLTTNKSDGTYGDGRNCYNPYTIGEGGSWQTASAALARGSGIEDESNYPYYPNSPISMGNYPEHDRYSNNGRALATSSRYTTPNEVKEALNNYKPVTVCFAYNSKCLYKASSGDYIYYNNSSDNTNHMVTIVGWDDNYPASSFPESNRPKVNGAWLIRNSHSSSWGNDGYCWISYATNSLCQYAGFTTRTRNPNEIIYQYDGAGASGSICNADHGAANVFTSKSNETLTDVGVYCWRPGTQLVVSVYKNIPSNYSSPSDGTIVYTSNVITLPTQGYKIIPLNHEIDISSNETFAIAMQYIGQSFIPLESLNCTDDYTSYAAHERQSYLRKSESSPWFDCTSVNIGNVGIKAYTHTKDSVFIENNPSTEPQTQNFITKAQIFFTNLVINFKRFFLTVVNIIHLS